MLLFKPVDRVSLSYGYTDDLGWGRLITGELMVREVPGDHTLILEEPNVQFVADIIKDYLTIQRNDEWKNQLQEKSCARGGQDPGDESLRLLLE
jgi:hypothetical protein